MRVRALSFVLMIFSCVASAAPIGNLEQLKTFLKGNPEIDRIENVLGNFSKDVRSNYLNMYNSRALQGASHDYHRIFMFSPDAKFIVAYNGDPSQPGYDRLEAFQFNDETESWTSFSKVFKGDSKAIVDYHAANKLPLPKVETKSCTECHRSRQRPNWDDYSINPGLVHDGAFYSKAEEDGAKRFEELRKTHARYKHLEKKEYLGDNGFGSKLAVLNYRRMAKIITGLPDIEKWKYAATAAVGGCDDMTSFIPLKAKEHGLLTEPEMFEDQKKRGTEYVKDKLARRDYDAEFAKKKGIATEYGADFLGSEVAVWAGVSKVRFVMQWLGEDMEDWSTARKEGAYAFRAAGSRFVPHDKRAWGEDRYDKEVGETHFVWELIKRFKMEKNYPLGKALDCADLKTKSLASLAGWKPRAVEPATPATGPHR